MQSQLQRMCAGPMMARQMMAPAQMFVPTQNLHVHGLVLEALRVDFPVHHLGPGLAGQAPMPFLAPEAREPCCSP